jgi:hypothetical protein
MAKKLNWFEYYFGHCFPDWLERNLEQLQDVERSSSVETMRTMLYSVDDDPYQECYELVLDCRINMDETYPKEFLITCINS